MRAEGPWLSENSHPGLCSDLGVLPAAARIEAFGAMLAVTCDERPDFWFGNYLVLPEPPTGAAIERSRAVWQRVFGSRHDVERMIWVWEGPAEGPANQLEGASFEHQTVLVLDPRREVPRGDSLGLSLRHATSTVEFDAIARLVSDGTGGDEDFCRWRQRSYAELSLSVPGGIWALWSGPSPLATAGFFVVGGIGRFQEVVSHPGSRGRGLASALCAALIRRYAGQPGLQQIVVVAEQGGSAERIYRRLGFERAGVLSCLIAERQ